MIALIRPPNAEFFRLATLTPELPLGLAYIAASLESSGAKVRVIDAVGEAPRQHTRFIRGYLIGLTVKQIIERIPDEVEMIGVSCLFTHEWPICAYLIQQIKNRFPHVPLVIGGEHVTALAKFSLLSSLADLAVLGEGEETIVELWNLRKRSDLWSSIEGIAFRRGSDVFETPRRKRIAAVDKIPPPAWHHFQIEAYHENKFVGALYTEKRSIPILATRGCPYRCTFCSSPNMWSPRWIARDPIKVVDEIENLKERYGAGNFPFQDLTAVLRKDWILSFCKELVRRNLNIQWQLPSGTRCEVIDDEVAAWLYRSGMVNVGFAPESGSESDRKIIKKQMKSEKLYGALRASTKHQLQVSTFFVLGFPHDSQKSMQRNLPFIKSLHRLGVNDIAVTYYMALPGTELFQQLYRSGKIKLDLNYFHHIVAANSLFPAQSYCPELSKKALFLWRIALYFNFYLRKFISHRGGHGFIPYIRSLLSDSKQQNRMQCALRYSLLTAWHCIKAKLGPRWISVKEQTQLMKNWDVLFRESLFKKI